MASSSFFGGTKFPDLSSEFVTGKDGGSGGFNKWAYEKDAPSFLDKSSGYGAKDFLKAFASGLGTDSESKYRRQAEYGGFGRSFGGYGGEWSKTGAGQVLDNLGVVYPQQLSPVFLPGQEGKPSQWGKIGGALLGAAAGFIPGVGLAGASLGSSLGGGLGSALFD